MGRVYAARDRETGAVVALKRFDPALLSKPDAERFLKQVGSARLLKHRNIVQVHEAGDAAGTVYVAMEMLEGESLRKVLDAGPLPVTRAIRIAHDIACGLAHAHLEGVVHGGLKPSNIVVLRSGAVKITDFGIGPVAPAAQRSGYMPPEQTSGAAIDHRCDIFSLGALFHEMLTRQPPSSEPAAPSELNPHVPRALDEIISSMLARQPASRMAGIPILLRELQRLEEALGLDSAAGADAAEPTAKVTPAEPEPGPRTADRDLSRAREPVQEREAFDYQKAIAIMDSEIRRERSAASRRGTWTALAGGLAVLGIGLAGYMYYPSWPGEVRIGDVLARLAAGARTQEPPVTRTLEPPVTRPQEVPGAASEPPREVASQRVADATPEPPPAPAPEPTPAKPAAAEPPPPPRPLAQEPPLATPPAAKAPKQQPGATARLTFAISPRGDIYIDGKHHGTTPPVTTFDLEPGMHRIEVRNGSRTPYLTYMTVQAGDVRRIRYDFDTSRAVHPRGKPSWLDMERAAR